MPYDETNPLIARVLTDDKPLWVRANVWISRLVQVPFGATSGALDAGDALGDKITFEVGIDGQLLPKKGRIVGLRVIDVDDDTLSASAHIFTSDFTAAASDAAFTISAVDAVNWVTSVAISPTTDIGSAKVCEITGLESDYFSENRKLVVQFSTSGTPTIAAGAMPWVQIFVLLLE